MASKSAQRTMKRESYVVGWIAALPKEGVAARVMFDEIHAGLGHQPQDENEYTLGRIGKFNIVLATLPQTGKASAAVSATNLRRAFPQVKYMLLVGIGGGVPFLESKDIRLGDIVVSSDNTHGGVIQYDFGKTVDGGKFIEIGHLDRPHPRLVNAVNALQQAHEVGGSNEIVDHIKAAARTQISKQYYTYPGSRNDVLYMAEYDGEGDEHETCERCVESKQYSREARESTNPKVFYGNIGSADRVMKHGATRDKYGKEKNILCFEMEAAGMMNHYHCLVIRGICDYADAHKNKAWQEYAATAAAAYAKTLLCNMAEDEIENPVSAADGDTYSPIRCANINCSTRIRWQQLVYWCILHNKCICEKCQRAGSQSRHLTCPVHELRLVDTRPQEFGNCSGKHPFNGRMPGFQGITCGYCTQFKICENCISEYRKRKSIETHACNRSPGSTALWIWKGTSSGVRRTWPTLS